jgi:hypothetical protein
MNRLCLKDYLPTDQDILHSRVSTTGSTSTHYQVEDLNLQVIDCGGARAERKKWATQFQDTRCLLFTVPLTGYDFSVAEDKTKVCDCNILLCTRDVKLQEDSLY